MRVIVAPDSFKGSLSSPKAAKAIAQGLFKVWPEAEIILFPLADGGEGTVEALVHLGGGRLVEDLVQDPLGRTVKAVRGLLDNGKTAVVETSAASGLTLLASGELNAVVTTSYGLGQQIRNAIKGGAERLIVGLGGSATNDAGAGMLSALGARLIGKSGRELHPGGLALLELEEIDDSNLLKAFREIPILVASDVQNPLVGQHGASHVYGPQKGAGAEEVERLDEALSRFASVAREITGRDVASLPGAGAAGGLGAAFMAFTEAKFRPGVELILEEGGFKRKAAGASLVVTGEGRTDAQTSCGKAPAGVAALASQMGVPTVCLSGSLGDGYEKLYQIMAGVMSASPGPATLSEAMAKAEPWLAAAAERLARLLDLRLKA
ncbi:MAG: glycerate kinase [Deltaproteobacteria bacterium]|jgi:glycerate kinase|nr:glycerate kinase [Deltaproteobacteria bacterium]